MLTEVESESGSVEMELHVLVWSLADSNSIVIRHSLTQS